MSIVDMLIDAVANNKILSFVDGHSNYNKIYLAEEIFIKQHFVA